jgi:hypothetical protein
VETAGDLLTIDELIARAQFEPSLIDIYVEGDGDVAVFRSIFDYLELEVGVFAVNARLDIRRNEVEPFSIDYGNRSKLIAAAARVHQELPVTQRTLTFIIDADWAHVVGPVPVLNSCLILTDLPSIEHYFFDGPAFRRFLTLGISKPNADPDKVRPRLVEALQDIAAARIALESVDVECIPKFAALCTFGAEASSADTLEIVRRSIDRIPAGSRSPSMLVISSHLSGYRELIRKSGHPGRGHDIAPLLIAFFSLSGHFADRDVVEALLRTSSTPSELLEYPFFQRVVTRVSVTK